VGRNGGPRPDTTIFGRLSDSGTALWSRTDQCLESASANEPTVLASAVVGLHERRRQPAPSPINTALDARISVEGSGIAAVEIEPLIAVNGIAFPLMSDRDVPTFRLAIVIIVNFCVAGLRR
jgi:hypothetical protein